MVQDFIFIIRLMLMKLIIQLTQWQKNNFNHPWLISITELANSVSIVNGLKNPLLVTLIVTLMTVVFGRTLWWWLFNVDNVNLMSHLIYLFESRALKNALFHVKFFLVQLFPRLWSQKVILHCTYLLLSSSLYFLFRYLEFEEWSRMILYRIHMEFLKSELS